ncbi:DNA repair and recombination protein RadB [Candidatus Pacearchaeota archaeon]|nr:DNA repair and recombination protein RadB [Candidatus Pacearchaeota archaeon]
MAKISAGSYDLDKWLYGGYETDIITTVYGPAGSGKTNFCVLAAAFQAKKGKKVIFIDTEGGFSSDRFKQIAGENFQEELKNILLLKPTNFYEQKKIFDSLLKQINDSIGLIIVDGITMLYRLEIADSLNQVKQENDYKIKQANFELAKQLRTLAEIARNKNIPVLATNQVYYEFLSEEEFREGKEKTAKMVGGDLLKYWSKCLIELKQINTKRIAVLKKHRSLPEKELQFVIVNEGIKKRGFF